MNPSLYGIKNSNRDFKKKEFWGKNQFNSSFPAALLCYMSSKNINPVYIKVDENNEVVHEEISVAELFKIEPNNDNIFFGFETSNNKFQQYFIGSFPRNDLTILEKNSGECLSSFEIKLTALPDNQTCMLDENDFGTELVVRPDTIIYQAAMMINSIGKEPLYKIYNGNYSKINDWSDANEVINYIEQMKKDFEKIIKLHCLNQEPLIIQPIWKTKGKKPTLSDDCLDVFIWSTMSLSKLYIPENTKNINTINRQTRTLIWFTKMIIDYLNDNQFNGYNIIDYISFNTKNDKAFSVGGIKTYKFMNSNSLKVPRIKKSEIKNIILGGGQNLLSPERRFDAIIYNTPSLFDEE